MTDATPVTAEEYLAEARRLMPYQHQAFDRICFVDAALKRDDAQLCYPYPPKIEGDV